MEHEFSSPPQLPHHDNVFTPPTGVNPTPPTLGGGRQPALHPQSNFAKPALLVLYLVVLFVGMFAVYSSQHSQLETAQKALVNARNLQAASGPTENTSIDQSKYQAVFLSNGQVYFGKIVFMNKDYLKLTDIYYLQNGGTNIQAAQQAGTALTGSTSLIKLGCELHAPSDLMVISQSRVDFWENLQDQGKVAQAIKTFAAGNPNGQRCPK